MFSHPDPESNSGLRQWSYYVQFIIASYSSIFLGLTILGDLYKSHFVMMMVAEVVVMVLLFSMAVPLKKTIKHYNS
jgi:hypothetical protein